MSSIYCFKAGCHCQFYVVKENDNELIIHMYILKSNHFDWMSNALTIKCQQCIVEIKYTIFYLSFNLSKEKITLRLVYLSFVNLGQTVYNQIIFSKIQRNAIFFPIPFIDFLHFFIVSKNLSMFIFDSIQLYTLMVHRVVQSHDNSSIISAYSLRKFQPLHTYDSMQKKYKIEYSQSNLETLHVISMKCDVNKQLNTLDTDYN